MKSCIQNNDLKVVLFKSVKDLPVAWNQLLPAGHFLQIENLELYETVHLSHIKFIYAHILIKGNPVANAYFQLLTLAPVHLNTGNSTSFKKAIWRLFSGGLRPRLLVAGHLFRHDISSFYAKAEIPAFSAYQYYQSAIRKCRKAYAANAVLIKDAPTPLLPYFQHYAPQFILLRNDISMQLQISPEWKSLSDYEKALKYKYAHRFRKIRRGMEGITVRQLSPSETREHKSVLHRLYLQVCFKQQVRLGVLSEDFLPALHQKYPEALKVWMAYKDGEPVFFFSAWLKETELDMFYIGFDYQQNEVLQLYFNILFLTVEKAISLGKCKLILGRTALEAKARLGCKPHYLSTFLYIRNPLFRYLVKRIQLQITQGEGEWETRRPFRQ